MIRKVAIVVGFLFIATSSRINAQSGPAPLKAFGFFQNSFEYNLNSFNDHRRTTFSAQQLNLFFQKDLRLNWTSFVNLEWLSTYSSEKQWGAFKLEELWVRYRQSRQFSLKIGLHIPTFNHLNDFKNRLPLLPYIVRPLVYEASLGEIIELEPYTPQRAFLQAYGFFPFYSGKLDYAVFLGNSPNVSSREVGVQSGIDTTTTFLFGGRLGLRLGEFKAGVSATRDKVNLTQLMVIGHHMASLPNLEKVTRSRLGFDLLHRIGNIYVAGETIRVYYDDKMPDHTLSRLFYYGTVGYYFTEAFFLYGGFWGFEEERGFEQDRVKALVNLPTVGASYSMNEMITLKLQYANVRNVSHTPYGDGRVKLVYYSAAISVMF